MGFLTWVLTGTAVGVLWRNTGRFQRFVDVFLGITGAVLLGTALRTAAEFDVPGLRPIGVRLFTWPNLIQAVIGSALLMMLFRRQK